MLKQSNILSKLALGIVAVFPLISVSAATPKSIDKSMQTPYNSKEFVKQEKFCNEFNGKEIDHANWINPTDNGFATWTFVPENVKQENGILNLTISYDKHKRGNGARAKDLYFNSGMLRSKEKVGYGYYEARFKGAPIWPGTCSAFWLYTLPQEEKKHSNGVPNEITYNEIDVIELQQVPKDKNIISCNMHIWALDENGKQERIMAGKYPKLGKNEFLMPNWDAEKDFHTYAVENRPDSVVFYMDNKRVASKPNYFWHKKMYIILSLGIRTPFEKYINNDRCAMPLTEDEAKSKGFPCSMQIDYVRSWSRDYSKFKSSQIPYSKEFIQKFAK